MSTLCQRAQDNLCWHSLCVRSHNLIYTDPDPRQARISEAMREYWTNFLCQNFTIRSGEWGRYLPDATDETYVTVGLHVVRVVAFGHRTTIFV